MAPPDDVAYAARVATYLVRRHGWTAEDAAYKLALYKGSLEQYGRRARERAPSMGLLKKDWGAIRGAILEVNDQDRRAGKRPAAKPRFRRPPVDHTPTWAREPDAPDWVILSVKPGTSLMGTPGWFASVESRHGDHFTLSRLEGETAWYADSHFGPDLYPHFAHGEGSRSVSKHVAKDPLATYLDRAQALSSQGVAGPYDPRNLGVADAPGQQRLFNPGKCPYHRIPYDEAGDCRQCLALARVDAARRYGPGGVPMTPEEQEADKDAWPRVGNPTWEPWNYNAGDPDDLPCLYCRKSMGEAPASASGAAGVLPEEQRSRVMTQDTGVPEEACAHEYCIPGPRQYDRALLFSVYDPQPLRRGNPLPSHCEVCRRPLEAHQDLILRGEKGWHAVCRRRGRSDRIGNPDAWQKVARMGRDAAIEYLS